MCEHLWIPESDSHLQITYVWRATRTTHRMCERAALALAGTLVRGRHLVIILVICGPMTANEGRITIGQQVLGPTSRRLSGPL